MGLRLPQADLAFNKYTDSKLISAAQKVHAYMLVLNDDSFPDPPIEAADFQALITNYRNVSAAALKGTKAETAQKQIVKKDLMLAMKRLALFANSCVWIEFNSGSVYSLTNARGFIEKSGFLISKDPSPVMRSSGIATPIVKSASSVQPGTLHLLLRQYVDDRRGTKMWQVEYRTSAIPSTIPVPAGPWYTGSFSSSIIDITGLDSGVSYDYRVAAIGGKDTGLNQDKPVNFTQTESIVII